MNPKATVPSWYSEVDALQRIDDYLRERGIDPAHLSLETLAPFDNFHSRGRAATSDQIALANFPAGAHVLDVGGGVGGPARLLASRTSVQVTVLDLTPSFVAIGRTFTERLGMSDRVHFEIGDGTNMPFADASFDGVWTQHSTMNIENKNALYSEIHRVSKPGSRLVMHEIMAGNGAPIDYPMPWAPSSELSFLLSADAMRSTITGAGFRELYWEDESASVIRFLASPPDGGQPPQPPEQTILFGPAFVERIRNFGDNLGAGKLVVIRALFERT